MVLTLQRNQLATALQPPQAPEVLPVPNLIETQIQSYRWLLHHGVKELLEEISPIVDFTGEKYELRFLDYSFHKPAREQLRPRAGERLDRDPLEKERLRKQAQRLQEVFQMEVEPNHSEEKCRERDITFHASLYVTVELVRKDSGEIIQKPIFFGDMPLMTERGTFIINGAERVVVSQLIRSPGVYFTRDKDLTSGRELGAAKLIPNRGAWLEFETSAREALSVKVDRKKKIYIHTFLLALGVAKTTEELKELFPGEREARAIQATIDKEPEIKKEKDAKLAFYRKLRPGEPPNLENSDRLVKELFFNPRRYNLAKVGRYRLNTRLGRALTLQDVESLRDELLSKKGGSGKHAQAFLTVAFQEVAASVEEYQLLTREDLPLYVSKVEEQISNLGPDERAEGPKLEEFQLFCRESMDALVKARRVLGHEDLIEVVKRLIRLNQGGERSDDIDHLGNRRIRGVGELIQNQLRIGLLRMERVVKERMTLTNPEEAEPNALINIRPVVAAIDEFFGGSQLSQFMDQTNPLAELTHKRRLSALGPGGLSRERAGFDVRDVHHSHYGRICPIETPEGPNIGLLGSLATYGRINQFGFIETPYRKVFNTLPANSPDLVGKTLQQQVIDSEGKVVARGGRVITPSLAQQLASLGEQPLHLKSFASQKIVYLSADREENYVIAQASARLDNQGRFTEARVDARRGQEFIQESPERVDYMDVSPKQIVSVSTALVPFLEHDDANRALMGSNMQRQAVPLLRPDAPAVGTGIEWRVSVDSGQVLLSEIDGDVVGATADEVVVRDPAGSDYHYPLTKYRRSNQGTCISQRVIVHKGDKVRIGQPLADSSSTDRGELALGHNVLVAFMSWEGYNYEDAIIISQRMLKEDKFTSIHIEKHECDARETKLGPEEITRDIPNVGEESLQDLDEEGVIRIGAEVGPGDIMVGKITPKGETELTPEEKLLRAIFGEKIGDVKDTSLRVPHGERGKIIAERVFSQENHEELPPGVHKLVRTWIAQTRKLAEGDKMAGRHGNKGVIARILPEEDMPYLPDGTPVDIILNPIGVPSRMNLGQVLETHWGWAAKFLGTKVLAPVFEGAKVGSMEDALSRVWLAQQANAIARDVDGNNRPLDLGKAKEWLSQQGYDAEKVWNDSDPGYATEVCLKVWLSQLGQDPAGQTLEQLHARALQLHRENSLAPPLLGKLMLCDGRTGQQFDQPITVGYIYMMKLVHLVEDKIHARSTGPYSLITQQPLGGKAQFGGQRFGEMEVWALEAYSAAYNLQEMLTIKSDDVAGRMKTYEAIVKGEDVYQPGVPESFHVLLKELQSLGLSVELLSEEEEQPAIPALIQASDEVEGL